MAMHYMGLSWERVEDGEYNEWRTVYRGKHVRVYSNSYGMIWCCEIDGVYQGQISNLTEPGTKIDTIKGAMREVVSIVYDYSNDNQMR